MPNHLQSRSGGALPPHADPSTFKSQTQHILDLLMAAQGGEVPLAEIMLCAAQYNACIFKLRQQGYKIVNRKQTCNGVLHSWFRLESSPPELTPRTTVRARSVNVSPAAAQPQPKPASDLAETLPLFSEMTVPAQQRQPERPIWRDPEMNGVKHG